MEPSRGSPRIVPERALGRLPDETIILPGAFSAAVCGRGLNGTPVSAIGFERNANRAFRLTNEQESVELMMREVPPRPPNADQIRRANTAPGLVGVSS